MPAIDAKVSIDGYDGPGRKTFAEANQAKVGEIGRSIPVFPPQFLDAFLTGVEVEIHDDQPRVDQSQNVRHRAKIKSGFGQHRFARDQRIGHCLSQFDGPAVVSVASIEKRDNKPCVCNALHDFENPLR